MSQKLCQSFKRSVMPSLSRASVRHEHLALWPDVRQTHRGSGHTGGIRQQKALGENYGVSSLAGLEASVRTPRRPLQLLGSTA